MDNLSHTLIGVLVGEASARTVPASQSALPPDVRRNLFVGVMAAGSNFPDLDFLYSAITGNKLDYLLQHRGHTHTVVGAIAIALLLFAACEAWLRYRKVRPARSDRLALLGIALLAPLLHIAMDFGNNYGVHPFWPFDNRWIYGDSVFIIEPLFWAAAAPLAFVLKTVVARTLVWLIVAAGVAVSLGTGLVPLQFVIALAILCIGMLAIGRYAAKRTAVIAGIGLWLLVTVIFSTAGRVAAAQLQLLAEHSPSGRLLDHVLTPMPVNPVCWEFILIQSNEEHYALRQGVLSLAPGWMPARACPTLSPAAGITAPLVAITESNTTAIQWRGEMVLPRSELKQLAAEYCQAADLLRFARVPFFTLHEGKRIMGDLRYDREPGPGFGEIELDTDPCPRFVPSWQSPRADLLK